MKRTFSVLCAGIATLSALTSVNRADESRNSDPDVRRIAERFGKIEARDVSIGSIRPDKWISYTPDRFQILSIRLIDDKETVLFVYVLRKREKVGGEVGNVVDYRIAEVDEYGKGVVKWLSHPQSDLITFGRIWSFKDVVEVIRDRD